MKTEYLTQALIRIEHLENALRVIARSSSDSTTREDAMAALAQDPRKRD
jgi:hypothetical protein